MRPAAIKFGLLVAAALLFSTGGIFMRTSEGLSRIQPSIMIFVCFSVGAALQAVAMRESTMSTIYVIVLGLEAITAFLFGALFLGERFSWSRIGALLTVVAGIAWLRRAG